ncbi:MAG: response regulator transcription factor [Pseudomonadota bacterium]
MRIAVVEDNRPLADAVARAFEREGHGVDLMFDGETATSFLLAETVDLVILDINLPGKSGLEVLAELRKARKNTPVLMLTARASLTDKVAGLDYGADDYLTKPFDLEELQARARALLRRSEKDIADVIVCGKVAYDQSRRHVLIDGEIVDLPRREFALAEILLTRRDHVISKEQIIEHLYGAGAEVDEGAVELYIHRLRKRLAGSGAEIKTLRGLGYTLRELS